MKTLRWVMGLLLAAAGALNLFSFVDLLASHGDIRWSRLLIGILFLVLAVRSFRRNRETESISS